MSGLTDLAEDLPLAFILICRKCGSENVVVSAEDGVDYGGETGWSPGHISFGCNNCHQNDLTEWV